MRIIWGTVTKIQTDWSTDYVLSWMWCTRLLVLLYWQHSFSECSCIVGFVTVNHFNFGRHTMYSINPDRCYNLAEAAFWKQLIIKIKIWPPVNQCPSIQFSEILDNVLTCFSVLYQSVPSAIIPLGKFS